MKKEAVVKSVKKEKRIPKEEMQWSSYEDVFGKDLEDKVFKAVYSEEIQRLKIAEQIKKLRTAKKLTQKVVAERTGMPQSVIARIESGQTGISLDTLGRIASAFGKEIRLA